MSTASHTHVPCDPIAEVQHDVATLTELTEELLDRTYKRQVSCYRFHPRAHAWDLSATYWLAATISWMLQGDISQAITACKKARVRLDNGDRERRNAK